MRYGRISPMAYGSRPRTAGSHALLALRAHSELRCRQGGLAPDAERIAVAHDVRASARTARSFAHALTSIGGAE
jgi:hypothetical protein